MNEQITKTQIDGIGANTILEKFQSIENKINEFQKNFQPKQPTELLTRKDVATLFSVSVMTIIDWQNKGLLIGYKIGNKVRYKRHEVEQALIQKK